MSVDETVNGIVETVQDVSSDEDEVPDEPISPPSRNETKSWIRLTLFTTDLDLDPLFLNVSNKVNQLRLDRMKQSPISDFFKTQ